MAGGRSILPFGLLPHRLLAGWLLPGAGGYLLYRGAAAGSGAPAVIDWTSPAGMAQPGDPHAYHAAAALVEGREYAYGLRAVSDAGVEETGTACLTRQRLVDGSLEGPQPNALRSATVTVEAAGFLTVRAMYHTAGEQAAASVVAAARIVDGTAQWPTGLGVGDMGFLGMPPRWSSVYGSGEVAIALGPFDDGERVELAVRAYSATVVGGPVHRLPPTIADASAPPAVTTLSASQAE